MLPLHLLGGHGSLSHAPLRGDMGAHPMSPQLRREGLIFAPPSPVSHSPPPSPPLGDLSHSSPLSHGSSSHVPPLVISRSLPPIKGGHGSSSRVPPGAPLRGDMGAHPMSPRG